MPDIKPYVILVEDNQSASDTIITVLQDYGVKVIYTVRTLAELQQLTKKISTDRHALKPDLAFVDIHIPPEEEQPSSLDAGQKAARLLFKELGILSILITAEKPDKETAKTLCSPKFVITITSKDDLTGFDLVGYVKVAQHLAEVRTLYQAKSILLSHLSLKEDQAITAIRDVSSEDQITIPETAQRIVEADAYLRRFRIKWDK